MSQSSTLRFGADTSELDAAFARVEDELQSFGASVQAMSASLAANSSQYRQQDASADAAYWQSVIANAEAASNARAALNAADLAAHRGAARQWQSVDNAFGRDFSDVAMAAITGKRGGAGLAFAQVLQRSLGEALSGIGRTLAGQLQSALGLGGTSPLGLLGSLFGSGGGGADVGQAAMQQLNQTMASMGLVTEGLDVTTAANTVATTANTAAESAGGTSGGIFGLAGLAAFAGGGRPAAGIPSIVGERGPELFVPDHAGTVIPHGGWSLPRLASPGPRSSITGGDFAPSISMPVAFHGGAGGMSRAEFRRMLGGNMDYLLGELKNMHRNAARPLGGR